MKRYLYTLVLYYLPYALLVWWVDGKGAQSNEAHAVAQAIIALLYTGMSLGLVVFRPQTRFAFESWMRRIMRWVLYLGLYIGLVLLPALLLLHAESSAFAAALPIPALLFLGMLYSPKERRPHLEDDGVEAAYPKSPLARGLYYALAYFVIFTGLAVLLKGPFDEAAVPNHFRPILFSMMLIPLYLVMTLMLTVVRPSPHFDFPGRGRRWSRFFIHVGLFALLAILLPFFPANLGSSYSWLAGIVPLFLFCAMVTPLRPPVRLLSVPKTTDSRWRGLKYSGVFTLVQLVIGAGLLGVWFSLGKEQINPAHIVTAAIILSPFIALLVLGMLYRLIVTKPHSRFRAMSRRQRLRRWWSYVFTYLMIQAVGPYLILQFWQWNFDFNLSIPMTISLFQAAAYGTEAIPTKGTPSSPAAPKETPQEAIQRRLNSLSQTTLAHPR